MPEEMASNLSIILTPEPRKIRVLYSIGVVGHHCFHHRCLDGSESGIIECNAVDLDHDSATLIFHKNICLLWSNNTCSPGWSLM